MTETDQIRLGRPASFEREELVAAALRLGPDNLALRKVADALGVPRTTVYNHVRSPDELGQVVLRSILASAEASVVEHTATTGWADELEVFAVRQRAMLLAAGQWLRYYDADVHTSRESLQSSDHLIGMLVASGFSVENAGRALLLVLNVVQESAYTQRRAHSMGGDGEDYLWRLSEDDFPWIAAARVMDYPAQEEQQFRYSLRCVLAGIAATRA